MFHMIDNAIWGEADGSLLQGQFNCPHLDRIAVNCTFHSSDGKRDLLLKILAAKYSKVTSARLESRKAITVSLYNIHSWGMISTYPHGPARSLPTDLSIVESEESHARFSRLFEDSFPLYDGNSTTSPRASIQRSYLKKLNVSTFLPLMSAPQMIVGAAFAASNCRSLTERLNVVTQLESRIRVDGLGKCRRSKRTDALLLKHGETALETLQMKQRAISQYLFYLAFENTIEPGYVTEKVMDALIAGTVPVYLGDTETCKKLLPHPRAAIFLDDFKNVSELADYLVYLQGNVSAYEEHRSWRHRFDPDRQSNLLSTSWTCAVCYWAVDEMKRRNRLEKEAI